MVVFIMKFIGVTLINIRWSFVLPVQIKCPCVNSTQVHIKMSWTGCVLLLLPWAAVSVRAAPPWGLVGGLDDLAWTDRQSGGPSTEHE